jgi:hypothetical protein
LSCCATAVRQKRKRDAAMMFCSCFMVAFNFRCG